jgi:hypothetical protein
VSDFSRNSDQTYLGNKKHNILTSTLRANDDDDSGDDDDDVDDDDITQKYETYLRRTCVMTPLFNNSSLSCSNRNGTIFNFRKLSLNVSFSFISCRKIFFNNKSSQYGLMTTFFTKPWMP